jgi:hypothetical protein
VLARAGLEGMVQEAEGRVFNPQAVYLTGLAYEL